MNREVIITCAVTGAGDTVGKHPAIPVTPEQIATAALEAAKAGAAVAHIHVRDVETGKGNRDPSLFREVVERIRGSGTDIVLNLTTGMGGDLYPGQDDPAVAGPGTDFAPPEERVQHVEALRPEICSLDCGTMNFGSGLAVNTPDHLRVMARRIRQCGVKPELEVFELGHIWLAKRLLAEGLIESPPLFQICLGIPWGAEANTETLQLMRDMLPEGAHWAAFGIGPMEFPMVAQSVLLGGHRADTQAFAVVLTGRYLGILVGPLIAVAVFRLTGDWLAVAYTFGALTLFCAAVAFYLGLQVKRF